MPGRKLLSKAVADRLRANTEGATFVSAPDHPLLLRGPDALTATDGALNAIFTPHAIERANPAHLASRLIASKLALPPKTKTVLLIGEDVGYMSALFENDFGLVAQDTDRSIGKFLADRLDFGGAKPTEEVDRTRLSQRFDETMRLAGYAFRSARTRHTSELVEPRFRYSEKRFQPIRNGPFVYSPRNRIWIDGVEVALISSHTRSQTTRQIALTISAQFLESFSIDTGHLIQRDDALVLAASDLLDDFYDLRSKETYAAAFAGVALAPTLDERLLGNTAERSRSRQDLWFGGQ